MQAPASRGEVDVVDAEVDEDDLEAGDVNVKGPSQSVNDLEKGIA